MKTVGDILKQAREDKHITLEQASEITKIRLAYLKALEEGDYDKLPSEVYVRGFLRNYAEFLELPVEDVFAFFRRDYKRQSEVPSYPTQTTNVKRSRLTLSPLFC